MRDSEVLKITKGGELLTVTVLCNYCETRFHSSDRRDLYLRHFRLKEGAAKSGWEGNTCALSGTCLPHSAGGWATLLNTDVLNLVVDVLKRCAISVVERQWQNQHIWISIKSYSDWKVLGIKKRVVDRHTLTWISKYCLTYFMWHFSYFAKSMISESKHSALLKPCDSAVTFWLIVEITERIM